MPMLDEHALECYNRAGRIAREVVQRGADMVAPGVRLLDIAEAVEAEISRLGGKPAFPVNLSVNEVAAHYSPVPWDELKLQEGDLLKIDVGVQVDGYIADTAVSRVAGSDGEKEELIRAAEKALERAIETVEPGVSTAQVGAEIEEVIRGMGFKPVENLTGHLLTRYNLHSGKTIPNVRTRHGEEIEVGEVFAIEPFATTGAGRVVEGTEAVIFRYLRDRPMRMPEARKLLARVRERYATLPFAERWLAEEMPRHRLQFALRELVYSGALHAYRVLREKEHAPVSQAEHTVVVTEDGARVIT